MVAAPRGVSSSAKAHESALSGLYEGPVERPQRQVEVTDRLAVHLDRALGDQTARFARRADPEVLDEERRQMDLAVAREHHLGYLLRRRAFPDHAREVLLGGLCGLLPV